MVYVPVFMSFFYHAVASSQAFSARHKLAVLASDSIASHVVARLASFLHTFTSLLYWFNNRLQSPLNFVLKPL
jgi:hypothetical protein